MDTADDVLAKARAYIRSKAPYLTPAVYGLIPNETKQVPTVATSARMVMHYNPDWVVAQKFDEMAAALIHEVSHVLRAHHVRFQHVTEPQDKFLANVAMDLAINPDLKNSGWQLPNGAMYPSQFKYADGLTAEEYYALLQKDPAAPDHNASGEGNTPGVCSGKCGSAAGQDSSDEELKEDAACGRSPIEVQDAIRRTAQGIKDHIAANGRGSVPGLFSEVANFILEEKKVDWRHVLSQVVRRVTGKVQSGGMDLSLRRPSKRSYTRGLLRPGMVQRTPEMCIIRDTSGSMEIQQLQEVTSEACHILQSCGIDNVWFFDADVQVSSARRVGVKELLTLPISGRGGTDFVQPIKQASEIRPRPDVIVYMTDGDGAAPEHPPAGIEVIWCIVNSYHNRAPTTWGHHVFLGKT